MNKENFYKFLKTNKTKIRNYKNHKFIMMVDRGKFLSGINNLMVVIALNRLFKLNPIIITDFRNPDFYNFYRSFGIKNFKIGFKYFIILKKINIFFKSFIKLITSIKKIKKNGFEWLINNFEVENIKIGDLVYDTYIRYDHRYLNPKIDIEFINLLFKAIFRTFNLNNYIKLYPTKFILVGTPSYCHNDGIALRVALKNNIKVFEAQPHQLIQYNYNMVNFGIDNLASNYFKKGRRLTVSHNSINSFFKKKNKGEIGSLYTGSVIYQRANKNKNKIDKKKLLKKLKIKNSKFKKIILVACHAFSDCPHINGFFVFRDYYSQLKETLEYISKTKSLDKHLWIFKPHPSAFKFKEKGIAEDLIKKYISKNIKLCPTKINTKDLINLSDNVITGRGSIGLETACAGKYPILGGSAAYSKIGFTLDPKNKKEYFKFIKQIDEVKPLTKSKTKKAKEVVYILENKLNQIPIKRSSIVPHDKFSQNIKERKLQKIKSIPERNLFSKLFLTNHQKIGFENDVYYKDLFEKLKKYK